MWVGEVEEQESEDFRFLREMAPVISTAAKSTEIDEIVVIDWAQRLSVIIHGNDSYWGWEYAEDGLMDRIRDLKKSWATRPVPSTPTVTIDRFEFTPIESHFYKSLKETGLTFTPQCWLVAEGRPKYRIDFMVYYGGRAIAVELDGHESHKTKEARNKDSTRDRFLLQRGLQTIRFTGSQVHEDVGKCIEELGMCLTGEKAQPQIAGNSGG